MIKLKVNYERFFGKVTEPKPIPTKKPQQVVPTKKWPILWPRVAAKPRDE
jgi:hypothetical protein